MDLQILYGNPRNFKEKKTLRKETMKENFKVMSSVLFSRKSTYTPDTANDKSYNVVSEKEYYVGLASSDVIIMKHFSKFD